MICGSPAMLADISGLLDARGFAVSPGVGEVGDDGIAKACVGR